MSLKGNDWIKFQVEVYNHIENYVIPQYGDKSEDECADYTTEDLVKQIKKYAARQGKNSRPGQDKIDLLKIAHYAQMTYTLLEEQENAEK